MKVHNFTGFQYIRFYTKTSEEIKAGVHSVSFEQNSPEGGGKNNSVSSDLLESFFKFYKYIQRIICKAGVPFNV